MYRFRTILIAVLALVISGGVTYLLYRQIVSQTDVAPRESTVGVVVASVKVNLGTRLTEEMVRVVSWPDGAPMAGSFNRVEEVIGRGVISPLLPNEPVLDAKLAPIGAGAGLTSAIPEGMRAVSVKVNEVIGVAGFVLPGTRVDVIVTGTPTGNRDEEVSKIVLENVEVLAAGQNVERNAAGTPEEVAVVTLLVSPEEAQKLGLASTDARIQLALRNPLDQEHLNPDATRRSALYQNSQAEEPPPVRPVSRPRSVVVRQPPPPPPPPAPKKFEIELIQGLKRDNVTVQKNEPPAPPPASGRP